MAVEEKNGGRWDEGESGTLAVSAVKGDEIVVGDGSVSSGGIEGVLSGVLIGEGSASVDDGDCGRGDGEASMLLNEDMLLLM